MYVYDTYHLNNHIFQSRCILKIKIKLEAIVLKTNVLKELFDKILYVFVGMKYSRGHLIKHQVNSLPFST